MESIHKYLVFYSLIFKLKQKTSQFTCYCQRWFINNYNSLVTKLDRQFGNSWIAHTRDQTSPTRKNLLATHKKYIILCTKTFVPITWPRCLQMESLHKKKTKNTFGRNINNSFFFWTFFLGTWILSFFGWHWLRFFGRHKYGFLGRHW